MSGHSFYGFIGKSRVVQEVFQLTRKAARTDVTVLIRGASGTGKELVAQAIHELSQRKRKPFIAVNTGSIPPTMVGSELFGHEKGAFTSAISSKKGCFEIAKGGTLLLDEISAMDENMQVSLLRVLETKKIKRVGGSDMINVNVRVITATNKDLWNEALVGRFREDLLFRLEVFTINLPPLRERREDIPLLAEHFLHLYNNEYRRKITKISAEVMEVLLNYNWAGNVRELQNTIQRAMLVCEGNVIEAKDLPARLIASDRHDGTVQIDIGTPLQEAEKIIIEKTLLSLGGNKNRTAKVLGISRKSLYNKMSRYGLLASSPRK